MIYQGYTNSVTKRAARPLRSVRTCRVRCGASSHARLVCTIAFRASALLPHDICSNTSLIFCLLLRWGRGHTSLQEGSVLSAGTRATFRHGTAFPRPAWRLTAPRVENSCEGLNSGIGTQVTGASRTNSTSDKGRLLAMAEAWLDLADRAYRLARHDVGRLKEYPLLSSKLGNEPHEAE